MTFVWTFSGVMEAIGLLITAIFAGIVLVPLWFEERKRRRGKKP